MAVDKNNTLLVALPRRDFYKEFLAGWAGGIAQVLVGQPFDTVKVNMQTKNYSSAAKCLRDLVAASGFRGLYKGTLVPLCGIGICVSLQFGVNENVKRVLNGFHRHPANFFLAGFASGAVATVVCSPIELIRIKMQLQAISNQRSNRLWSTIEAVLHSHRIFQGAIFCLIRESFGMGIYFSMYEHLRSNYALSSMTAGGLSGATYWLLLYPIDVIKSKAQSINLPSASSKFSYISLIRSIWAVNGARSFYGGLSACLLRSFPVNATTFCVYEWSKQRLNV